ncbi:SpoIIE family protein phosphatase [Synechococcus moorigangaii CMS01]|nr:SpoIIE family protein phosphatase [Synechococcus moorigangaii CMS01]
MSFSETNPSTPLTIQVNQQLELDNFRLEILEYLGEVSPQVHSFKVAVQSSAEESVAPQLGLLRVGSPASNLARELELRSVLQDYAMVSPLLAHAEKESVILNFSAQPLVSDSVEKKREEPVEEEYSDDSDNLENSVNTPDTEGRENEIEVPDSEDDTDDSKETADILDADEDDEQSTITSESVFSEEEEQPELPELTKEEVSPDLSNKRELDYLEEEHYDDDPTPAPKLLLLSTLPEPDTTLANWLKQEHSPEQVLTLITQICQAFSYIHQKGWCFIDISPELIELEKLPKFIDLTTAFPTDKKLPTSLFGGYCAPELAQGHPIDESMSSYTIGALLYESIHKRIPDTTESLYLEISPIPRIYQLLKICLSPMAEDRFPLSQLRNFLMETRNSFREKQVQWNVASHSTVGLSTSRLQNEDNYGVRQHQLGSLETMMLGVVADGMGGMAQGEIASQIAVQTALEKPIPANCKTQEQWSSWLLELVQEANQEISQEIKDGGTTISVVLAIAHHLMLAHVGDSRIYLLRHGEIQKLSEDHTFVATLVASGQITYEESLYHPDRNVLIKSLGSKRRLSDGYVQQKIKGESSISLENGDILLLCSDGVWDLVTDEELATTFSTTHNLQEAVAQTINNVLEKGASDNATLLALQCRIETAK